METPGLGYTNESMRPLSLSYRDGEGKLSHIYLTRSDIKAGYNSGRIVISETKSGMERSIPLSAVDGISVFGQAQLSTQLIRECLVSNIPIVYYSEDGHYFGMTSSFERIDPIRQKRQIALTDNLKFCLEWSKQLVSAKIRNSIALLESKSDVYQFSRDETKGLYHSLRNLALADDVDTVLGFEGNAAKNYFQCLAKVVEDKTLFLKGEAPALLVTRSIQCFRMAIAFCIVTSSELLNAMGCIPILHICIRLSMAMHRWRQI